VQDLRNIAQSQVESPGLSDQDMIKVREAFRRRLTSNQIRKLVDMGRFYRERKRNPEFEALVQQWLVGHGERQARRVSATRKSSDMRKSTRWCQRGFRLMFA
jgi:hypothetical protein